MAQLLKGRHLVSISDFNREEVEQVLDLTKTLKAENKAGKPHPLLNGRTLGMIFEKSSTRTRVSFEVGMYQLGGMALYLSSNDLQLGRGETIADTAKVISRYVDGIMARVYKHNTIQELALNSSVSVINGLCDLEHPCQVLCDLFTIKEKLGVLKGVNFSYLGDGNNMANSILLGTATIGMNCKIIHPDGYAPDKDIVKKAKELAKKTGAKIEIGTKIEEMIKGSDIVYSDVWTSMGQEKEKEQRLKDFKNFQINSSLMKKAGSDTLIMHCLPAHRGEEITNEVIDGPNSIVFDQAENRLHTQKAIMALLIR